MWLLVSDWLATPASGADASSLFYVLFLARFRFYLALRSLEMPRYVSHT